ncbi:hypothetical protein C8Q80DRAFT_1185254 [Daedaleopsis nitida]|nr:hypothetical protein C8Q80DRAFT_1185254 [Daedaleopsis nitida]
MPLPTNTLSLVGLPPPGDSMYQRPRHAMIVRMSAETFDALDENDRKLEVELGENPGLHIGGQFFPVQHHAENTIGNHELYLRVPTTHKPMAPLKLYANVIGKFMVERELGEKVQESVREATLGAEKARTERKAIYLDKPPDLSHTGKVKKKDAAPVRRAPQTSNFAISSSKPSTSKASHTQAKASSLSSSSKVSVLPNTSKPSPLPSSSKPSLAQNTSKASPVPSSSRAQSHFGTNTVGTSSESTPTRTRLIHCVALKPRTMESVISLCAGKDATSRVKNELVSLLQSVAEPVPVAKNSDPGAPVRWQLKLDSWQEVRPYEWPHLTEEERTQLARQARQAFRDLRIPKSDPLWDAARFRPGDEPEVGSRAVADKNGVMMTKTKKMKSAEGTRKKVSDIVIPAKDESSKGRVRDLDESSAAGTPTSATRPPARRQPGSGYKVKQSATPPVIEARGNSPLPPIPKKPVHSEPRDIKREPAASPVPAKAALPAQNSRSSATSASQVRKKVKEPQSLSSSRAAEERREERAQERAREREVVEEKPRPLPSFKRKQPVQDGNDSEYSERDLPLRESASKKRKLDDPPPSSTEKARGRDLSLPKKPVLREPSPLGPHRHKIKKESSPLAIAMSPPSVRASLPPRPPVVEKPHRSSSSSSNTKSSKTAEPMRSSKKQAPVYTSSEDESDRSVPTSVRARGAAQAFSPSDEPPAKRSKVAHTARWKPGPLPTDSAGLRKYYITCYQVYDELRQDETQRRQVLQRLLGKAERDGDGEVSEEDVDVDKISPEGLQRLVHERGAVENELKKVRGAWERLDGRKRIPVKLEELVDVC